MLPDGGASIEVTVAAVKKLFSAYGGYQRGKLAESDQALREEVRRRSRMVREHVESAHDRAHRKRLTELRRGLHEVMEACDSLEDDAKFSTSHTPSTQHAAQANVNRKTLKKLVQHDLDTLQRLLEATRGSNQLMVDLGGGADESELLVQTTDLERRLNGARNHFRERNMLLDGYTKR